MSLSKAFGVINGINEFGNFFQLAKSAISYLRCQWNGKEEEIKEHDVLQWQSDLRCLNETLPAMYNLMDRAEWRCHEKCVAELLPKLKDAVYDAEDILEEFGWFELNVSVEGSATQPSSFIDFFHRITQDSFNTVTDIQKRLKMLSSQLDKMVLYQLVPRFDKSLRPETTSFPTEPKIFGREKELKELIGLIGVPTQNSSRAHSKRKRNCEHGSANNRVTNKTTTSNVSVLPIVGLGGLGKTTLAQDICNHPQVRSYFDLIIWTCVSDDFDVKRLTKNVLQSFSGGATDGTLDFLQLVLANNVKKKRLLLILDDLWDDALKANGQHWNRFCAPFTNNVLQGSMMLVTTRSLEVANKVCTMDPFPLEGLKSGIFWDFFKLCVFGAHRSNIDSKLEQIARQILPKLKGSPLAAKTLGRLLGMSHPTDWERILKSELWELRQGETEILPALRLSYIYLPFHLKRCFSFCAVYPKDHEFDKLSLVKIWIAEGFVQPEDDITPIIDVGHRYFDDLANRSFFQVVRNKYVIHDLMHDMAQLVSKGECIIINNETDVKRVPESVRHLSVFSTSIAHSKLSVLLRCRKLRTLFVHLLLWDDSSSKMMELWCSQLRCMRVFVCDSAGGILGSINNMKHLRYLNITSLGSSNRSLPSGLCCFYSLQFLHAEKCNFEGLPSELKSMINLQTFDSRTVQYQRGDPKSIAVRYYPGDSFGSWLQPQNLSSSISQGFGSCAPQGTSFIQNSLSINQTVIPTVRGDINNNCMGSIFMSLEEITIEHCQNLSSLDQCLQPAYVPAVKKISIEDCERLVSVPTERFGDLLFLEELKVSSCPNIKSRKLLAPSLKKLKLSSSGDLGDNIECRSLTHLDFFGSTLTCIKLAKWNLPALQNLMIGGCPSITYVGGLDHFHNEGNSTIRPFSYLTVLKIYHCSKLQTLDDVITPTYLPAVQTVEIYNCRALLSLPGDGFGSFPDLKDLDISYCPSLNWGKGMMLPSSLQRLSLRNCGDFSAWFPGCLENLSSLRSLEMISCECIMSIPGHFWSTNLTSLQELCITACPNLVSIGGPNAIANLKKVYINACAKLKELHQPVHMRTS